MSRSTGAVLCEVAAERERQDMKWGEQNHPDGTGDALCTLDGIRHDRNVAAVRRDRAEDAKRSCERAASEGAVTYRHILEEEWREACAEDDAAKLRSELVQVAAVAVAWIEAIDRREAHVAP